jgi:hypothetical protein
MAPGAADQASVVEYGSICRVALDLCRVMLAFCWINGWPAPISQANTAVFCGSQLCPVLFGRFFGAALFFCAGVRRGFFPSRFRFFPSLNLVPGTLAQAWHRLRLRRFGTLDGRKSCRANNEFVSARFSARSRSFSARSRPTSLSSKLT